MLTARTLYSPAAEADRFLPEGPRAVTVAGRAALAWVNIQTAEKARTGAIHLRFWATGEHRGLPQPARPAFILPTDRPDLIFVGREKELGTLHLGSGAWEHLATIPDTNPRTIINDGTVVPGGRAVVFGTKDIQFKDPIASLYLFTLADRRVTVLAEKQTCSNGKVFARTADGLVLYDIDTPRRVVTRYRFDLNRRSIAEDGVAVDLHAVDGFPDGMIDTGEGSAIIAIYNPGSVVDGRAYHYDLESGERIEEWNVPGSPRVTCPLLIERDGGVQLVLTTAVEGMPDERRQDCPNAGNLFLANTNLSNAPVLEYVRL